MNREMVCIQCPRGCKLHITGEKENLKITGNLCPKGITFAKEEAISPMRTISSTVKTSWKSPSIAPVRVSSEIPKSQIFRVMEKINSYILDRPVKMGDVLIKNINGLGVDVIVIEDVKPRGVDHEQ